MKKTTFGTAVIWDTLLVVSVVFAAFILPVLPPAWQRISFITAYTLIYITAIFSLEKRSNYTILLFVVTVLLAWVSSLLNLQVILTVSRGVNIVYFLVIVISLIRQIASAREVTPGVILSSIAGYLLMGIIYSIFIAYIIQHDPAAFTPLKMEDSFTGEGSTASIPLYFGYVTLGSLGYGDIVPLKPYTRSLATWIVISGQFYMAIIVALLVGKFSARQHTKNIHKDGG
jgi:voltage-gated potassium channel